MQEYWESRGTEADPWHECGSAEVNIAWIWSGYGHPKIYNMYKNTLFFLTRWHLCRLLDGLRTTAQGKLSSKALNP